MVKSSWFLLPILLLVASCGGETRARSAQSPDSSSEEFPSSDSPAQDYEQGETESAPRASCDDGTCFECGDGVCLEGFYCDQDASGGAACSWLPDCAKSPSCSCIEKVLGPSCECHDAGGPMVSCH